MINRLGPFEENSLVQGDAGEIIPRMYPSSVDLIITSPPYNVGIDYGGVSDLLPQREYLSMLASIFRECFRIVVPGGFLFINIDDGYIDKRHPDYMYDQVRSSATHAYLTVALAKMGWIFKDTGIWVKRRGFSGAKYYTPGSSILSRMFEFLLLFRKPGTRGTPGHAQARRRKREAHRLPKELLATYMDALWEFPHEPSRVHPAPFPEELPRRAILLWSFKGDMVFDPFAGSGTTAVAALNLERRFFGCDIAPIKDALQRLEAEGWLPRKKN